ncbi:unnamed protein product, partial [Ectocarpus sp. 13 AM-2016]
LLHPPPLPLPPEPSVVNQAALRLRRHVIVRRNVRERLGLLGLEQVPQDAHHLPQRVQHPRLENPRVAAPGPLPPEAETSETAGGGHAAGLHSTEHPFPVNRHEPQQLGETVRARLDKLPRVTEPRKSRLGGPAEFLFVSRR